MENARKQPRVAHRKGIKVPPAIAAWRREHALAVEEAAAVAGIHCPDMGLTEAAFLSGWSRHDAAGFFHDEA